MKTERLGKYNGAPAYQGTLQAISDTILVVDSDCISVRKISKNLHDAGFAVVTAKDGEEGLTVARRTLPSLLIVEVDLPEISGLEICRSLRADTATESIQIVILTARQSEIDRILGFEFGADDYVAKPYSVRELVLRVKAVLRRATGWQERRQLKAGPITIDHARCCALVEGQSVELTPTEFKLLGKLVERPNVVQSRDALLSEVWGDEHAIDNRSVDTYLRRLRNKLGRAGQQIKTVYGFGYRLAC